MQVISRRIDKLGRIVLPMDYRKALGLCAEAEVILGIEGTTITIKSADTTCKLCGSTNNVSKSIWVCSECVKKIKSI